MQHGFGHNLRPKYFYAYAIKVLSYPSYISYKWHLQKLNWLPHVVMLLMYDKIDICCFLFFALSINVF